MFRSQLQKGFCIPISAPVIQNGGVVRPDRKAEQLRA
jgi:hypothetical protein